MATTDYNLAADRGLPSNVEAERSLLGAILLDNTLYTDAGAALKPDDFFLDAHRRVYSRMLEMADTNRPIDIVTLSEELSRHKKLEAVGGVAYLSSLTDGTPRRSSIEHYDRLVRDKSLMRSVVRAANTIMQGALEPGADANQIVSEVSDLAEFLRKDAGPEQDWRALFKSRHEMEQGDLPFLIDEILPEGIGFIGGLAFTGKTWLALSIAKALTTGRLFLNRWRVPEKVAVLYLVPEAGEKSFRARLDRLGMPDDLFLCRTIKDGLLRLDDPRLLAAVKALRSAVILDTAIRFSQAKDENSATENQALMDAFCRLIKGGAKAVLGLHHSAKSTASVEEMTLENVLRGTGDLGAMADVVYGLKCVDQEKNEIRVQCVKARDFECTAPFHITGQPFINELGDFVITTEPGAAAATKRRSEIDTLGDIISAHPWETQRTIVRLGVEAGIHKSRAEELLKASRDVPWVKKDGPRGAILYGPLVECPLSGQSGQWPDSGGSSVHCPTPLGVDSGQSTGDSREAEYDKSCTNPCTQFVHDARVVTPVTVASPEQKKRTVKAAVVGKI